MTKAESRKPKAETPRELRSHPAVRNYTLFCLAALFLLVVCLANQGFEWWCLVPALIGCLTLLTHWNHGPPLVLLSLVGLYGMSGPRSHWTYANWARSQTPTAMDVVLCLAVLAYVSGHYRLLSLTQNIFPPDPRRRGAPPMQRRSADLVTGRELALLWLSATVCTGLAWMLWVMGMTEVGSQPIRRLGPAQPESPVSPLDIARELGLVWAVLIVLAAAGTAASYLRRTTATPEESLLYLQEECWRQTRREQGLLNRWLTWARLRGQRKKEPS